MPQLYHKNLKKHEYLQPFTWSIREVELKSLCSAPSNRTTLSTLSGLVRLHSWMDTRSRAASDVKLKIWETWFWSQMTSRNWAWARVRFVVGLMPVPFRLGIWQTPTSSKMSLIRVSFNWKKKKRFQNIKLFKNSNSSFVSYHIYSSKKYLPNRFKIDIE